MRRFFQHGQHEAGSDVASGAASEAEDGFLLLFVIFLVAILLISLAVAAPKMAKEIQRDKELELWHRGMQYKRAIKLYYRKYGSYPTSVDQLVNTNEIRFLRKRYKDPMTGKDDWKPVYFGQVHVPTLGLFGQPLTAAGAGGTAGVSAIGGSTAGLMATSSSSTFGGTSSPGGASSLGSTSSTDSGSGFGSSSDSSGFGSDSSGSGAASSPMTSGTGTGLSGATGTATGTTTGAASGSMFASSSSSSSGGVGGVGPIVGVVIPDTRASIMEYKKQKHYNQWEFVYDPLEDQLSGGGAAAAAASTSAGNVQGFSSGSSSSLNFGQIGGASSGSSTSGSSSGTGTSGSSGSGSSNSGSTDNSSPQM